MKIPMKVGDATVLYELFTNPDSQEHVVAIDDKTYRLHKAGDLVYTMLRVAGHMRSMRGSLADVLLATGQVHLTYRQYETRVRRAKEEAQRVRDRDLNAIAESLIDDSP